MVRRTAAIMAALGFALACLLGAVTGCSIQTALGRALVAGMAFFLVGLGVGWAGQSLLSEHFEALAESGDGEGEGESQAPSEPPEGGDANG